MKQFEVLPAKSTAEGVGVSPCEGFERTTLMYVINDTNTSIRLCLFQAKCSFADQLPEPYIADTGVFVGGVDLGAGDDCQADPCIAGGHNKPIAGSFGSCSARIRHPNGQEQTLNFPSIPEAGEGNFYPTMGWRLFQGNALTEAGERVQIVHVAALGPSRKL